MRAMRGSEERIEEGMVRAASAERGSTSDPVMFVVF
jgi:hypothetical protein